MLQNFTLNGKEKYSVNTQNYVNIQNCTVHSTEQRSELDNVNTQNFIGNSTGQRSNKGTFASSHNQKRSNNGQVTQYHERGL